MDLLELMKRDMPSVLITGRKWKKKRFIRS